MDRGEFFQKAFKLAVGKSIEWISDNPILNHLEELSVEKQRPPGAAPEVQFQELCTGCDQCMIACPINIIMIEDQEKRLPLIYPRKSPVSIAMDIPAYSLARSAALFIRQ